jgi:hypothetical protein
MDELGLPPMVTNNEDPKGTAFSISVDATKEQGKHMCLCVLVLIVVVVVLIIVIVVAGIVVSIQNYGCKRT